MTDRCEAVNCEALREQLKTAPVDSIPSGAVEWLAEQCSKDPGDEAILERYLLSKDSETRSEVLLHLVYGYKRNGLTVDVLCLYIAGLMEDTDSVFTAPALLRCMAERGDAAAARALHILPPEQ